MGHRKVIIGYTQGTFDTLHFGHVNLLKNAKEHCDFLIVGVNSDELVLKYKNKETIIKETDRKEIVSAIKYVDKVIICDSLDKLEQYKNIKFDLIFIGDDWKGHPRWEKTKLDLKQYGVDVIFIPYTQGISTTIVKEKMIKNKSGSWNDKTKADKAYVVNPQNWTRKI